MPSWFKKYSQTLVRASHYTVLENIHSVSLICNHQLSPKVLDLEMKLELPLVSLMILPQQYHWVGKSWGPREDYITSPSKAWKTVPRNPSISFDTKMGENMKIIWAFYFKSTPIHLKICQAGWVKEQMVIILGNAVGTQTILLATCGRWAWWRGRWWSVFPPNIFSTYQFQ